MKIEKNSLGQLVISAMLLALTMFLPFLTGQIKEIGSALSPMHIPVLMCGFFAGPVYGAVIGFIAPALRFVLFGMPPIMPIGAAMCFELAAYGFLSGVLYEKLPKTKFNIYVALIGAMLGGRIVWGLAASVTYRLAGAGFGINAFLSGAFLGAIPGIILHILLIPPVVMAVKRNHQTLRR